MTLLKYTEITDYYLVDDIKIAHKDEKEVQQWLSEGNIPEPEFTPEELAEQARLEKVFKAKSYLASTDYKVLPDYDGDTTGIVEARAEARNTIRTKEVL